MANIFSNLTLSGLLTLMSLVITASSECSLTLNQNIVNVANAENSMATLADDHKANLQIPEHKIKAALILNIANNLEWPDEKKIKEFCILIIDSDTSIYHEIKGVENQYLLKGKPIKVSYAFHAIKEPTYYSIIFLGHDHNLLVNTLYPQIAGKGILLITDEGTERLLTMVNLYTNQEKQNILFEINRQTLEENGFTIGPRLVALGGNFIDIKELYLKTYEQLTEENKKLQILQADLIRYQKEKNEYESEIRTLNERLGALDKERVSLEIQYSTLNNLLRQKDSLLMATSMELSKKIAESKRLQLTIDRQLALISSSQNRLDSLNQRIALTQNVLNQKQNEIAEQEKIISEKESIIIKQQRRFFILLIALIGITLTLAFAFWAYNIKRKLNIKLEQQVQKRTNELNLSREHYQRLFEHSPVAMFELDLSLLLNYLNTSGISLDLKQTSGQNLPKDRLLEGLKFIKVTNVNNAALQLLNFESKEDATANYVKTYSEESILTLVEIYKALIERRQFSEYEGVRMSKNGKKLFVIQKWIVLPGYSHNYSRVLLSMADITRLKEYENELTRHRDHLEEIVNERTKEIVQLNDQLKESNNELMIRTDELEQTIQMLEEAQKKLVQQEKMASLGMLTAGIAHEINNPINFISGSQQAMGPLLNELWEHLNLYREKALKYAPQSIAHELEPHTGNQVEELYSTMKLMLRNIETGIERTTGIIKSLKAFVQTDSKEYRAVSVPETVADVLTMLRGNYKDRIEVIQQYDPNLPKVRCYANQLHQVMMNLVANAIDAIPGKGKIEISTHYYSSSKSIAIKVKDSGVGIAPKILEKIFDPFFTTKEEGKGTGLGLYITYNIIKSLNGDIEVNSSPGSGAEFTITLPVEETYV